MLISKNLHSIDIVFPTGEERFPKKRDGFYMIQNYIRGWGSSYEEMWSTMALSSSLLRNLVPVRTPFLVQVNLFKNQSYSIGQCAKKKTLKKQQNKKREYECTMNAIHSPIGIK